MNQKCITLTCFFSVLLFCLCCIPNILQVMYKTFCQLSKLVFQLEKGSYEFSSEELHFSNDSSAINYSWAMEKKVLITTIFFSQY